MLGLAVTELLTRLFLGHVATPDEYRSKYLEYTPAVFARSMFPEHTQNAVNESSRTRAYVNSRGYRGAEFDDSAESARHKIVVMGGSFVFDIYNNDGETWLDKVKKVLEHTRSEQIEIINAGIPGHSASDAVGRIFAEIYRLRPSHIVLAVGWNDIKDLADARPLIRIRAPYNEDGDPFRFYQGRIDRFLGSLSQIYMTARNSYFSIVLNPGSEGRIIAAQGIDTPDSQALAQLSQTLRSFIVLVRECGADPVLLIEPTLVSERNEQSDKERIEYGYTSFSHRGLVAAYEAIKRTIYEVARTHQVNVFDRVEDINGHAEFFYDHVHLTRAGSEKFGGEIGEQFVVTLR